jgi:hypothetical protein
VASNIIRPLHRISEDTILVASWWPLTSSVLYIGSQRIFVLPAAH